MLRVGHECYTNKAGLHLGHSRVRRMIDMKLTEFLNIYLWGFCWDVF
jgi:hypothetical protein